MTAGWAQHPVCTPSLLAAKFAADRLLPTAEKLATVARLTDPTYVYPVNELRHAWDALICNDEHGYGTSYYKGRSVYDTWMQKRDWIDQATKTAVVESGRALRVIAKNVPALSSAVLVFNPTLQPRREIVEVELPETCAGLFTIVSPDGKTTTTSSNGNKIRFHTTEIPPFGYAVFTLKRGPANPIIVKPVTKPPVLENTFYRLKFDNDGAITSVFDKQLERELVDAKALHRCNQLVYSKDRNKTFVSPTQARFAVETSALGQTAIVTLDDGENTIEALVFPETYKLFSGAIQADQPLLVCGTVSKRDDQPKLIVREVYPLGEAPRSFAEALIVSIRPGTDRDARLQQFYDLVQRHPGKIATMLRVSCDDGHRVLIETGRKLSIDPTPEFLEGAGKAVGRNALRFLAKREVYLKPRTERRWQPRGDA